MYSSFNIKICYYILIFIPIPSKLELFAVQLFESKLFPDTKLIYSWQAPSD